MAWGEIRPVSGESDEGSLKNRPSGPDREYDQLEEKESEINSNRGERHTYNSDTQTHTHSRKDKGKRERGKVGGAWSLLNHNHCKRRNKKSDSGNHMKT